MNIIFRACEKQGSISTTPRWEDQPKPLIMKKCFASLQPSINPKEDTITILHDSVTAENLFWMRDLAKCPVELIPVPEHEWTYNLHTIKLIDVLEEKIADDILEFYFLVEDDYLFTADALTRMRLTAKWAPNYFLLPYDYPDLYRTGAGSDTHVIAGPTNHWRQVRSSTMTVGGHGHIWVSYIEELKEAAPTSNDHVFKSIYAQTPCISPLPGFAAHLTPFHLTPYYNWKGLWDTIQV